VSNDPSPLGTYLDLVAGFTAAAPEVDDWHQIGWTVAESLTQTLDETLGELAPSSVTIVAVGGYGRRQMCLASDVDLMILHDGEATASDLKPLLYPLWDAKLKVGHSVRTPKEAVGAARENIQTMTALLSGRVVCGDAARWDLAASMIETRLGADRLTLQSTVAELEWERRQAEPFHLLAPDLKAGRGGLRTAQSTHWLQMISERSLDEGPLETLQSEVGVLLSVRNGLHAIADRPIDTYEPDLREGTARWLGQDQWSVASALYRSMRTIEEAFPLGRERKLGSDPVQALGRWMVRSMRRPEATGKSPMEIIAQAAGRDVPEISSAERLKLSVGKGASWTKTDRSALVSWAATGSRGYEIACQLHDIGWLEKVLPELSETRGQPQLAPFHSYQLDGHLWATAGQVVSLTNGEDIWCASLAESLGSIDDVLIGALFHDIGKGHGGDHSEVGAVMIESFATRVGFDRHVVELLRKAVKHHLLLPQTATRRDIEDPQLIRDVAKIVGTPELLATLGILSAADGRATGPGSWSAWKAGLVRTLYERVSELLGGQVPSTARVEEIASSSGGRLSRVGVTDHVGAMPPGYLRRYHRDEIVRHMDLAAEGFDEDDFRMEISQEGPATKLVLVTLDRPGTLVAISGVLALHNIDVLDAQIATSRHGVGFDTFYVCDGRRGGQVTGHRWELVRKSLQEVFAGDLDLPDAVGRRRAALGQNRGPVVHSDVRCMFTEDQQILEVRAPDRTGLLFDLSRVLLSEGLSVDIAKLESREGRVTDVLYLSSEGALSEEKIQRVIQAVL